MQYDYFCDACKEVWEEKQFLNDRDVPLSLPCPHCKEVGSVKRGFFKASAISYGGSKSVLARAGSGWNDVLMGVKKASAKNNTIITR